MTDMVDDIDLLYAGLRYHASARNAAIVAIFSQLDTILGHDLASIVVESIWGCADIIESDIVSLIMKRCEIIVDGIVISMGCLPSRTTGTLIRIVANDCYEHLSMSVLSNFILFCDFDPIMDVIITGISDGDMYGEDDVNEVEREKMHKEFAYRACLMLRYMILYD
jgi:hypothetical protein